MPTPMFEMRTSTVSPDSTVFCMIACVTIVSASARFVPLLPYSWATQIGYVEGLTVCSVPESSTIVCRPVSSDWPSSTLPVLSLAPPASSMNT